MTKFRLSILMLGVLSLLVSLTFARDYKLTRSAALSAVPQSTHVMVTPAEVKWGPAPPALPKGAMIAVLEGDPSQAGAPFTIRAKFPNGYKIPPHWHPTDEHVVVLQGTIMIGVGEKFSATGAKAMPTGSYMLMPQNMKHFASAKGQTIIQIYGVGPFEVNYVNPSDDPRTMPGH